MAYTNSPLVSYVCLSPNNSGQRTHSIDRITPHCVVGQCSVESLGNVFLPQSRQASSNYGIGADGRVGMYCEEKNRSWCSSSNANDQRAVTIECASDSTHPYAFKDVVYNKLIDLCVDICQRNGKSKLLWFGDKNKTLNYSPKPEEMVLTVHRWFANKSCPGDWMYARMNDLAIKVTNRLGGAIESGLQAKSFMTKTNSEIITMVAPLFTADQKKSGILASVSMAQFILESGYGLSELALNANNVFGMKKNLSGNTWSGSTWDGVSVYTKETKEDDGKGNLTTITADFRKYPCIEKSIGDHSAYLLGAMKGDKLRYAGLSGCKDYKEAIQIIKDGGYATSSTYVEKLCRIIEEWNLTQYDVDNIVEPIYPKVPFLVKVHKNLEIMKSASDSPTGKYANNCVVTIMEVNNDYGRLKSGAGWIYIGDSSYVTIQGTVSQTPVDSIDAVAREVIQGKWGNGAARKKALTNAGYDYNKVQARVNELMKK